MRRPPYPTLPEAVLLVGIFIMATGALHAQFALSDSQLVAQGERLVALKDRVDKLDLRLDEMSRMINYGLVGIVANLAAHAFQIRWKR